MGIKKSRPAERKGFCKSAGLFGIVCGFFRKLGRADLIVEEQIVRPHRKRVDRYFSISKVFFGLKSERYL